MSLIGEQIRDKKIECLKQGSNLEKVLIHPQDLVDLLQDFKFVPISAYMEQLPEKNESGSFEGVRIIVTDSVQPHMISFIVNMGGYRSLQDNRLKTDAQINPSRRY